MFNAISKFWKVLNAPRVLEISYYFDEPIVPDCEKERENQEQVKLFVDFNAQRLRLKENEEKSKRALRRYIKSLFEKQGLLITEKQLNQEVEHGWKNLKDSFLVNGFNEFQPAIKEVL